MSCGPRMPTEAGRSSGGVEAAVAHGYESEEEKEVGGHRAVALLHDDGAVFPLLRGIKVPKLISK